MKSHSYHRNYSKEKSSAKSVDWVLIRRMSTYLYPYRWWVLLAITLLLISKAIETIVPIYIGNIVHIILAPQFTSTGNITEIYHWGFYIAGWLIFAYLLDVVNVWIKSQVGHKALFRLRTEVFEHIQKMSISFFDHQPVGRLMTRTIHDVDQLRQLFTESVVPLLGSLFLFVCIFIAMIILDWRLGLFFLFVMPCIVALTNSFRNEQRRCYDLIRSIVSVMNTFVQEHILGALTIRNFGLQKKEKKRFEEINEDHCYGYIETIRNFSFFMAGIDFAQSFVLIVLFGLLYWLKPLGEPFQAGTYFTFSLYVTMCFRPLVDLAERYNILQAAMAASERIFGILDEPEEKAGGTPGLELLEIESIIFDNVWFAYENEHWILRGLSFEFKKGESIGLVGITGEGKSTIISLLLRFYDIQRGTIKINGHPITDYSRESVRRCISVVLQDPVLFSGTLDFNISLNDPEISDEKVHTALDKAGLKKWVDQLPGGLHYQVKERGKGLSAGQMQLVSIARAVAFDRSLFIMDEATANIDVGTEKMIQNALSKILKNKTSLVIAHRLTTIHDVDQILVLNKGEIIERGKHDQLMSLHGFYEKLYTLLIE